MMKGNRTRKKRTTGYTRVTLAMMLTALMVVSSLSPVCTSFAEAGAGDDGPAKVTEAAKKEAPKSEEPKSEEPKQEEPKKEEPKQEAPKQGASDQGSEPKATAPEDSGGKDGSTEGDRSASEEGEDPEVKGTEPADPAKQDEDKADENRQDEDKQDEDGDEKMPAQSFSGSAGGVSVKATAGEGVFPKGTKMMVSPVSSSYVIGAAKAAMGDRLEVVDAAAVDITFYKDGGEIQPEDGSVSVKLNAGSVDGEEQEAVHVTPGGGVQFVGGASDGFATFRADHFSIYGIIGGNYDPSVEQHARYTYIFKAFGEEVDRQTVIDGEELTEPDAPKAGNGEFKGWMIEGESAVLPFPYVVSIPDTVTEDREIVVNAVIAETFRATFWRDGEKTDVLETKTGEAKDVITTGDVTWKFPDGKAITGWTLKGQPVASFEITEDVDLLPVISEEVFAVSFETGEGSPVPTVFVEKGNKLTKPADPVRSGYAFKGWFTDSACTTAYDFDAEVSADFTLHAKWEGQQTTFRVVYWQENANDGNYTIREVVSRSARAGETAAYEPKNTADGAEYQGFTLNSAKSDELVLVKGDGTTIKNVYYDRKTYPFSLYKVEIYYEWWDLLQINPKSNSSLIGTEEFKYQADTSAWYNRVTGQYPDREWFTTEMGTTGFTAPPPMQPPGGGSLRGFTGLTAYGRTVTGGLSYTYYLDIADRQTEIFPKHVGIRTGWFFTDEDHIIIPGWTFTFEGSPKYETIDEEQVYVGRLYYSRNSYRLFFDPQDGTSGVTVDNVPYEADLAGYVPKSPEVGDKKTINGIEKTFVGWFDNEAGLGSPVDFSAMKMPALSNKGDTLMFYGRWMSDTHLVSFDLDGGQYDGAAAIDSQEVESGNQATAPDAGRMSRTDPTYGEMTFGGWQDEKGNRFSFDTRITRDVKLKAVWHTDRSRILTVQYDANGGQGSFGDDTLYQDGAHAIVSGQPIPPRGKYFVGWKIGSSDVTVASGAFRVRVEDADAYMVVNLTAQFADKPVHPATVVYNANGGKFDDDKITREDANAVVNGDYTVADYAPTRDGHTFKGWALTPGATAAALSSGDKVVAGKSGNVLYAVYEQDASLTAVNVVITGNSETKTYTGSEQEVTGFKYKVYESGTSTELPGAASVTLAQGKAARASGTDADEYMMGLTEDHFNISPSVGYTIDNVQVNDGKLTISAANMNLTATGYEGAYDGAQHGGDISVNAAGATIHYSIDGRNWSYEPPLIKDAGEFTVYVKATNPNYNTATAEYTLKVTPAPLTVTTGSASKPYDGTPLTKDEATIEGLAAGETATVRATGSQTDIGRSANTYSIDWGTAKAANYTPVENLGVLEVTSPGPPAPPEVTVTITGKTASLPYDGQEHSVSGYDVEITGSDEYTEADFNFIGTAEARGTETGVYPMGLTAQQFVNTNLNFDVTFDVADGYLEITRAKILGGGDEEDNKDEGGGDDPDRSKGNPDRDASPNKNGGQNEDGSQSKDGSKSAGASQASSSSAKTGDSSFLILYLALMLAAIAAAGGIVARRMIRSR